MPTPRDDETHDEWMERCVPMVVDEGRDSEQAVAMCQSMWDGEMSMSKAKANHPIIAITSPVTIIAAADGDEEKTPEFDVMAYTGVAMNIAGYELPLVIDLAGVSFGKSVVANLDHDSKQRVGHVTEKNVTADGLRFKGIISADTQAAREVVSNAKKGFPWQASVEAYPGKLEEVPEDEEVEVNGQTFQGPIYVARTSKHVAFAFVSHGADENTTATIAATAPNRKERKMDKNLKAWIESTLPGFDIEAATPEALEMLEANYNGQNGKKKARSTPKLDDGIAAKQAEVDRQEAITEVALKACDSRPYDIEQIKSIAAMAIDEKWSLEKFRLELYENAVPPGSTVIANKGKKALNDKVLEAAVLMAGRHPTVEKDYPEQILEAANKRFRHGIGLKQLFVLAAEANGYNNGGSFNVDIDVQRAAFRMTTPHVRAAADFSTISLPNVFSNVANKFLRMGWDAVDQTPLRIAAIRPVSDFKQITTVSLTGGLLFQEVGPGGEIEHGTIGEEVYNNQVKTRGIMYSITRENIINDDLGALTQIPRRMGRGGMLTLNHVFWTAFLNNSSFFASGNSNINEGVADMTVGGLSATETIFMNQTDPDGNPLLSQPAILLVPTALKAAALTLMSSERLIDGTGTAAQGDANIWRGRFRVESSPYLSNSAYTGFSAAAWYMLADPNDIPVIEIAALNGRIEPTVETAEADFNVLGVRMRGYDDIGVALQEPRGGVRADGGTS
jgi:hypothetical protein